MDMSKWVVTSTQMGMLLVTLSDCLMTYVPLVDSASCDSLKVLDDCKTPFDAIHAWGVNGAAGALMVAVCLHSSDSPTLCTRSYWGLFRFFPESLSTCFIPFFWGTPCVHIVLLELKQSTSVTSGAVRRLPEAVSLSTIIASLRCAVYSQRGDSQRSSVPPLPQASPVFIGHWKWSESGHMTGWANGMWCEESCVGKSCNMLNNHN